MARASSLLARDAPRKGSFDILIEDGFVLSELAGVVDVLRIANRIGQNLIFSWTYRSLAGGIIQSSSEAMVETQPLPQRPDIDYAIVLGNADRNVLTVPLRSILMVYKNRATRLFLLSEAASAYIRSTGKGDTHTTHWENRISLAEETDATDWGTQLARDHEGITTCAGMGATVDLMLSIVQSHVSKPALMTISDVMLHDRIRDLRTPQPFGKAAETAITGDADLDACVTLMQANMEEPLAIQELCRILDISSRSLERKFSRQTGMTPNSYYRELRLNRASTLLLNTSLSIREVGLACGFASGFAPLYKSVFGRTPAETRRQQRTHNSRAYPKG
jgi:transcriptional regulator GlxA family with amidase domain